jgi:hypothetical protein
VPPATGPSTNTDTDRSNDGSAPIGPTFVLMLVVAGAVAMFAFRRVIGAR